MGIASNAISGTHPIQLRYARNSAITHGVDHPCRVQRKASGVAIRC